MASKVKAFGLPTPPKAPTFGLPTPAKLPIPSFGTPTPSKVPGFGVPAPKPKSGVVLSPSTPKLPIPPPGLEVLGTGSPVPSTYGARPNVVAKPEYAFGERMNGVMELVLRGSMNTYVWSFPPDDSDRAPEIEVRDQPYSRIDWEDLFKDCTIIGQRVDGFGKMRTLGIEVIDSSGDERAITLYLPPSQPLNQPYLDEIEESPYVLVQDVFGPASAKTDGGVWYRVLDYEFGVYIPISGPIPTELPNGPLAPIYTGELDVRNPIKKMQLIRRQTSVLLQLIEWLWRLSGCEDLNTWWPRYVVQDSSLKGQPFETQFAHKLPYVTTTDEGLHALVERRYWPLYFRDTKIHLYDELYIKCYYYFKRLSVELAGLKPHELAPVNYIKGLYEYETDFKPQPQSLIFVNPRHLQSWLTNQGQKRSASSIVLPIRSTLNLSMTFYTEPYLYRDKSTFKIYIVQNVRGGDFRRAVSVVLKWNSDGVNIGSDAEQVDFSKVSLPYAIYGISKEEGLTPIIDRTLASAPTNYFEFLCYAPKLVGGQIVDGTFAALLPIL